MVYAEIRTRVIEHRGDIAAAMLLSNLKNLSKSVWVEAGDLQSNSFSPETSRISPVFTQPKLQMGCRMFFVKPEVLVTQNHAQNSAPKFRLFIPD
jgi:tRNA G37 N-methylase TrmD